MRNLRRMATLCGCVLLAGSIGCSELLYERQDKNNVRRQFHLPGEASFVAYDANPKSGGFFGREGLSISAAVQFTDASFERYLGELDDQQVWEGVPFVGYSPDRAETYSDAALRWTMDPDPDLAGDRYRHWDLRDDALRVEPGLSFAFVSGLGGRPAALVEGLVQVARVARAAGQVGLVVLQRRGGVAQLAQLDAARLGTLGVGALGQPFAQPLPGALPDHQHRQ